MQCWVAEPLMAASPDERLQQPSQTVIVQLAPAPLSFALAEAMSHGCQTLDIPGGVLGAGHDARLHKTEAEAMNAAALVHALPDFHVNATAAPVTSAARLRNAAGSVSALQHEAEGAAARLSWHLADAEPAASGAASAASEHHHQPLWRSGRPGVSAAREAAVCRSCLRLQLHMAALG